MSLPPQGGRPENRLLSAGKATGILAITPRRATLVLNLYRGPVEEEAGLDDT
jgi:hypothetical protein